MKILITGGAGFIGQKLIYRLLEQGHLINVLDNFSKQIHDNDNLPSDIADKVNLFKGDIRDHDLLKQAVDGVEVIVHLAAETGTGQSMYEISRYFDVNVQGTALLLDILQNTNHTKQLKNIVVASSRAIYGEGAYICKQHGTVYPMQRTEHLLDKGFFDPVCPICNGCLEVAHTTEIAPFQPLSFYGLTKQIQEQAVLLYAKTAGINGFALRYQNVYGPGQSLKNPYTGILAIFSNLARQNKDIEIYEDGVESRDFVYIDDVVNATLAAVNYSGETYVGALNVGTGVSVSVFEVANAIVRFFNSKSKINISARYRIGDIRHNIADASLLKQILDIECTTSFVSGLKLFLDWASSESVSDTTAYALSLDELEKRGLLGKSGEKNAI